MIFKALLALALAAPAAPVATKSAKSAKTARTAKASRVVKQVQAPAVLDVASGSQAASDLGSGSEDEAAALVTAQQRAVGEAMAGARSPLDDEASSAKSLEAGDVSDNSDELSVDVDRWVLHDVLQTGEALSRDWAGQLALQQDTSFAPGDAPWPSQLHAAQARQAMRGEPQQHHDIETAGAAFDIPLKNHPLVDLYIDYFTGRGRWFFARWLNRASVMVPLMQKILAEEGLPQDLVYLAMVESGFSAKAFSTAAASGYWQFMPSTGALYGLTQDRFVDERRDFIRSTEAAGKFLHSLHQHFHGDWHLAWASYNAGETRIRRAMAKTGAKTFWQFIDSPHGLAKETVHYVPKIIAAAIVAKDAARFGFRVEPGAPIAYDQVNIDGALDIRVLAKRMGQPLEALQALNPSLLYDITPPNRKTRLRVPAGQAKQTQTVLAQLPPRQRMAYQAYKVRSGDNLSNIARRMHASLDTLRAFNRLKDNRLRIGQELIVPSLSVLPAAQAAAPARKPAKQMVLAKRGPALPASNSSRGRVAQAPRRSAAVGVASHLAGNKRSAPKARHVVASGDTLWSIARRYKVPVKAISRHNRRSHHIRVGDIIEIF